MLFVLIVIGVFLFFVMIYSFASTQMYNAHRHTHAIVFIYFDWLTPPPLSFHGWNFYTPLLSKKYSNNNWYAFNFAPLPPPNTHLIPHTYYRWVVDMLLLVLLLVNFDIAIFVLFLMFFFRICFHSFTFVIVIISYFEYFQSIVVFVVLVSLCLLFFVLFWCLHR